jgi:hypothetical protein
MGEAKRSAGCTPRAFLAACGRRRRDPCSGARNGHVAEGAEFAGIVFKGDHCC